MVVYEIRVLRFWRPCYSWVVGSEESPDPWDSPRTGSSLQLSPDHGPSVPRPMSNT